MATTTNYSWTTPDDTALVKDGAAAIRSLGTAIDTTVFNNAGAAIAKTIVDAKGDIIAATAADTLSRLAVGANDTVLTADSSTATGLKWAAVTGGGKVLQVVMGTSTTSTSITSTSYQDSGLSATITPSSASNKVLALIAQYAYINDNSDSAGVGYRLVRDSTAVYTVDRGSNKGAAIYAASASTVQLYIVVNGNYLDTPATTSATTYKMQGVVASGDNVYFQHDGQISTLILLEIGA